MKKRTILIIILMILIVAAFLITGRVQTKILFSAIDNGDFDTAKFAIDFGADVNGYKYIIYIPDVVMMNPTPLVQACKLGDEEIVDLLLANGADINLPDKITGKSPLLSALHGTKENRYSLAFYLIQQGADIHIVLDNNSAVAECLVFSKEDPLTTVNEGYRLFCFLLENGAPIDGIPFLENALTYAVHYGNYKAAKYLLDEGYFHIDEFDEAGSTALISAVKYNQIDLVDLLLSYGANTDLKDAKGLTAVDYAIQNDNKTIIDMLSDVSDR